MPHRPTKLLAAGGLVAVLAAGCVTGASPAPSGGPTGPSASPTGFYLRAWTTQALPPADAFAVASRLAIADGMVIDTAVAVPAIYPGPLLIEPLVRSISAHGIATIVAELRAQGLLVSRDFTPGDGPLGGVTAHLELVVDGTTYGLTGDPTSVPRCGATERCVPDPGTPGAFTVFWQRLTSDLATWLGADLGPESRYDIERLAILTTNPIETFAPIEVGHEAWPLAAFATFGSPLAGGSGQRCGTIAGADVATLLPILRRSNQLTLFKDTAGIERSLVVRPLLPREPDPCAGGSGGTSAPPPASVPAGTSTPPGASPSSASGSTPGSTGGLGQVRVLGLACFGEGPIFPPEALSGPATAERGADEPAAALRAMLAAAGSDVGWLPKTGWRRVAETAGTVLFIAEDPVSGAAPYDQATVVLENGRWTSGGWGACRLMAGLAGPFRAATWTLAASVAPQALTFTALVRELSCSSGTPAAGRISEPLVAYGADVVTITFGVAPLTGNQDCPGVAPSAVVVTLREPLGDRRQLDGALYPPAPVLVEPQAGG